MAVNTGALHRRASGVRGCVHDVSPENAGWDHVGFALHALAAEDSAEGADTGREAILVIVEGRADVRVGSRRFGELGTRESVFATDSGGRRPMPSALYVRPGERWSVTARSRCTLAVCTAPGEGGHESTLIEGIEPLVRGAGSNLRHIHPIAMEERDVADRLLVTEVFTPAGHWSSYPPHRHDEDDFPRITYLEETYYHRLNPAGGFAVQRVFTEDGSLDETMAVADGDVVLVPRGHHPCAAPHGFELYYLNVMAGPRRRWRFEVHPDFEWLTRTP